MNNIETIVLNFLNKLENNAKSKKYLLAVSGGVDSMCLLNVFKNLSLNFEIAHCNFKLRDLESDKDELFIQKISNNYNIKLHTISFETQKIARETKMSIQETARNLRYDWFFKLLKNNNIDYLVTAHHKDDSIETFFINAIRGSGIKGLKSIPKINNNIIRPFTNIFRHEIEEYTKLNNIKYREDSSNKNTKYSRNFLRNKIIPKLDNVHTNARKGIANTIENLTHINDYIENKIKEDKKKHITLKDNKVIIKDTDKIPFYLTYRLLNEYGFNNIQTSNILNTKQKGKVFYSNKYSAIKSYNKIIIEKTVLKAQKKYTFHDFGHYKTPINIKFTSEKYKNIIFNKNTAYLDADKINFPFTLRKWENGDFFYPLGLKGKKKLSDFFTDIKLNILEKKEIWILESNNDICWILGNRIDDRFKITPNTKRIIRIDIKN